ncbi:hypothetical protein MVEN_01317200 [Mycena venus]|uniref:Uncharacterized protein n=1 Tax=Mycena venus TaxID=2733690 RepID=A0A8H6XXM5_9AGAR|nr:hypothetical protein MVEN_01317200 [Mycena venus]
MLTSFCIECYSWWSAPNILFNLDVQPYPRLRTFVIRTNTTFLPPLPTHLVCLEIASGAAEDVGWNVFYDALQPLVELEILKLGGFPVSASTSTSLICLPNLLLCPRIRQYSLNLVDVGDIGDMFRTVLATLSQAPRSMVLHRDHGQTYGGNYRRLPNYMDPGDFQHAMVGFAYAHARDLGDHITPDVSFSWTIPLDDYEFATIFSAMSEVRLIDNIQWLLLIDWNVTPQESWRRLLQRLARLQTLVISRLPASGLLWDLVHQLEASATTGEAPLCPDLTEIEVNRVDCSVGGWIARRGHGPGPVNSYVDLDGARFLEVLVCYLELRPIKLPKLKLVASFNYTGAEVKLLRRLVDQLRWDGLGAVGPSGKIGGIGEGFYSENSCPCSNDVWLSGSDCPKRFDFLGDML